MIITLPDDEDEAFDVLDDLFADHGVVLHSTTMERVIDALVHLSDTKVTGCYCEVDPL